MSNIAIRVDRLSKQYKIGFAKQRHDTLRDEITEALTSIFRFNGNGSAPGAQCSDSPNSFWALKDVSFEVEKGRSVRHHRSERRREEHLAQNFVAYHRADVRIREIHGRVGSLLEVGIGFHQELTGRENIYLNGAILGHEESRDRSKFRRDRRLRGSRTIY